MNKFILQGFCIVFGISTLFNSAAAEETAIYQWQTKRLMTPSDNQKNYEKCHQSVFIYEGLRVEDIEAALDAHFNRIEHMMFVGTVLPPTAAGGEVRKEEDGC